MKTFKTVIETIGNYSGTEVWELSSVLEELGFQKEAAGWIIDLIQFRSDTIRPVGCFMEISAFFRPNTDISDLVEGKGGHLDRQVKLISPLDAAMSVVIHSPEGRDRWVLKHQREEVILPVVLPQDRKPSHFREGMYVRLFWIDKIVKGRVGPKDDLGLITVKTEEGAFGGGFGTNLMRESEYRALLTYPGLRELWARGDESLLAALNTEATA